MDPEEVVVFVFDNLHRPRIIGDTPENVFSQIKDIPGCIAFYPDGTFEPVTHPIKRNAHIYSFPNFVQPKLISATELTPNRYTFYSSAGIPGIFQYQPGLTAEKLVQDREPGAVMKSRERYNFINLLYQNSEGTCFHFSKPLPSFQSINSDVLHAFESASNRFKFTPSVACLHSVMKEERQKRLALLETQPVVGLISLSEGGPEYDDVQIIVNAAFAFNNDASRASMSFKISSSMTANQVMNELITRTKKKTNAEFGFALGDLCFHVPGTNEIIAGDYPMWNFVIVQNFIDSKVTMLKLTVILTCDLDKLIPNTSNFIEQQKTLSQQIKSTLSLDQFTTNDIYEDPEFESNLNTSASYESQSPSPPTINLCPLSLHIRAPEEVTNDVTNSLMSFSHVKIYSSLYVHIDGVRMKKKGKGKLAVSVCIRTGTKLIEEGIMTEEVKYNSFSLFGERLKLSSIIARLPRYACLNFELHLVKKGVRKTLGYVNFPLYDRNGQFNSGSHRIGFFDSETLPPTPVSNSLSKYHLFFRLNDFPVPVFYKLSSFSPPEIGELSIPEGKIIQTIMKKSPLSSLSAPEIQFLTDNRWKLTSHPEILPAFLSSIDFTRIELVSELPTLLQHWAPLQGPSLLAILGPDFLDPTIRNYVVKRLETWTDKDISLFLLQLAEALQYEPDDDSELALFLIRRAVREPKYLGLQLFWQLQSMTDLPWFKQRALTLTTMFVSFNDPTKMDSYLLSYYITDTQRTLCRRYCREGAAGEAAIRSKLTELPKNLQLPIDPKIVVTEYVPEKTKIMDSAKKPLFLTFKLADPFSPRNISMMLKLGDDLRQDQLVLQIFKVMDLLWKQNGLNMRLSLYNVLPTGANQGLIEIVPNAVTISSLQRDAGRFIGAFASKYITKWLTKVNDGVLRPEVVENFKVSLAGYSVATYVMGIGDRHCSNMMLKEDGHFFHIDFGHFLGHFKKKFNIERENGMFYLNDAFVHVLGDDGFNQFIQLCGQAFNVLRFNARTLIHILILMLGTGIPELATVKDIEYLEKALRLDLSPQEAHLHFEHLIQQVLASSKSTINDFFHLQAH